MRKNKKICIMPIAVLLLSAVCISTLLCGCDVVGGVTKTMKETNTILNGMGLKEIPLKENDNSSEFRPEPLPEDEIYRFYRNDLEDEELEMYELIRAAIAQRAESIDFRVTDVERLITLMDYVCYDNPEYFWFTDGCTPMGYEQGGIYYVTLKLSYNCTEGVQEKRLEEIDAVIGTLLGKLEDLTDYEKVKFCYEFIIKNAQYDEGCGDPSCYSVFVQRTGSSESYTNALHFMLHRLGVQTIFVPGTCEGKAHCWSLVKVNGSWYQLDTAWGDPVTEDGSQIMTYTYFLSTDKEIKVDHKAAENIPKLPECRATGCNYYVWQGRYLDSLNYDYISKMLCDSASRREVLEFKCSNSKIFEGICTYLFESGGMEKAASFAYYYFPTFDESVIEYSTDAVHNIIRLCPAYDTGK